MSRGPCLMWLLLSLLMGNWSGVLAQQDQTGVVDQAELESRLTLLQQEISKLQLRLEKSRAQHQDEQAQLRAIDLSIQAALRKLRELNNQHAVHLQELDRLEQQRDEHIDDLQQRQERLAAQINETYRLANQSRIKLVLNHDNPAHLNRMLAYYDHINRAQVEKITALRDVLAELEKIYAQMDAELLRIQMVQNEQQLVLDQEQVQRIQRKNLLVALAAKIDNEKAALSDLEHDRKDLEILLEKLVDVLADIPSDIGQHLGVAAQKGRLGLPLSGRVVHGFGQGRAAGMKWQGWLIDASTGTEVRSIAYGRVAFADWFRGYGLLMIIDHSDGFMSLYGYNESLLWEAGDWVESGAVIATVGKSAGGEQGLYFEMRKEGKAVDPAVWLKR